jgi:hypothetical protein
MSTIKIRVIDLRAIQYTEIQRFHQAAQSSTLTFAGFSTKHIHPLFLQFISRNRISREKIPVAITYKTKNPFCSKRLETAGKIAKKGLVISVMIIAIVLVFFSAQSRATALVII